jgi:hypothetical protein
MREKLLSSFLYRDSRLRFLHYHANYTYVSYVVIRKMPSHRMYGMYRAVVRDMGVVVRRLISMDTGPSSPQCVLMLLTLRTY